MMFFFRRPIALFELLQKPYVVLKHMPDVIDRIHQSSHSLEAKAKRKAGIDCWIDADSPQDIWMHHARSAKLDPARTFAWPAAVAVEFAGTVTFEARKIKLRRRLSKREV